MLSNIVLILRGVWVCGYVSEIDGERVRVRGICR